MIARRFEIPAAYRALYCTSARPPLGDGELALRWLGTAGFEIRFGGATLLIDPYLTRTSLPRVLATPLGPDPLAVGAGLERADWILVGHSHFDHLMDVPAIALKTGATVVGSASTAALARAAGVPAERLRVTEGEPEPMQLGPFRVRFVRSQHGKLFLNWRPFLGTIEDPRLPLRVHRYKMGGAFGLWIEVGGTTLFHNGSADLIEHEMAGLRADVLLLGLAGRRGTPQYTQRMLELLRPKLIIPTHHDYFFQPLADGIHLLPFLKIGEFFQTARATAPESAVVMTRFLEEMRITPGALDEPRRAVRILA